MNEPCSLCGTPAPLRIEAFDRPFHLCPACDLIFVPRHLHLSDADQVARYALHQNTLDNEEYVSRFERLISMLKIHVPGIRRVLDYGCGPGPVLVDLLRCAGYDAEGFDPHFAPNTNLSRPFDAVLSTETFEHFSSPGVEIPKIVRLIRPGGCLAVMTEFHRGPEHFAKWHYPRDPTHVAFYSPATFVVMCRMFGLELSHSNEKNIIFLRKHTGETNT